MSSRNLRGKRASTSLIWACLTVTLPVTIPVWASPLSLPEAISRAAKADPVASVTQKRLDAADAAIRQAAVRPNPSIGMQVENLLGSNPYQSANQAETTLSYQQPLERKAKREARIGAAFAERELVRAEGRMRTWETMSQAQIFWVEGVVAEAELGLAHERLTMAEQIQAEISRRVNAARDPLFAGSLANTDVANARIAVDQATAKVRQFKSQLAALWGGTPDIDLDAAWLEITAVPTGEPVLLETPNVELLRARQRVATSQIRVETARRLQDPTASVGMRHFKADGAVAFIVGGSIPLNWFDNNRGNMDRARAEAEAADAEIELADRYRQRDIAASTLRMSALRDEVQRIGTEVIPEAQKALAQVREGFARGGFTYRDVTAAQQTLTAAKARRVEVLKSYHLENANRDRLSGKWSVLLPEMETGQ